MLKRLLNIKPGEGRPVLLLTMYYFFITATAITGRSVSNALFFSRVENARAIFPFMLITVTLAGVIVLAVYTRLAKRVKPVPLFMATGLLIAGLTILLRLFIAQDWTPFALFVLMELVNVIMFFQFYIFAGTIFDTRQAKRIFGVLGVGGAIASILSGLALSPFTRLFGSESVLFLAAGFIVLWVLMIWLARPYTRQEEVASAQEAPTEQVSGKLDSYLLTMGVVIVMTIMVSTTTEYQFKVISTSGFGNDSEALTSFFGSFFALVGFFQIIIRLFVVGNLLTRFGVLAGLVLLPVGMGLSSIAVLLNPTLWSAVLLKAVDQVLRYTTTETAMELLWVPIPPRRKLAVKPLINGTLPTIVQGIAGLTIVFVISSFEVQFLSVVILIAVGIWLPLTLRLRNGYVAELMKSLQEHNLVLEDLTIDSTDATIVNIIERSLNSDDEVEQAFTLGLIENLNLAPWAKTLNRLFRESDSFFIRQKILDMAGDYPAIIPDNILKEIIQQETTDLVDEAMRAAGRRKLTEIIPILEKVLEKHSPAPAEIKAAAAHAVLTMNTGPVAEAQDVLREMLENLDANESALALRALQRLPTEVASAVVHESTLRDMLRGGSTRARQVVLEMVTNPGYWAKEKPADNETILSVAFNLRKPSTRAQAIRVLGNYPDEHVTEVLATMLRAPNILPDQKIGILQALQNYPTLAVAEQIINEMDITNLAVYTSAVSALLQIARTMPLSDNLLERINDEVLQVARAVYKHFTLLAVLGKDDPLLEEIIWGEIRAALPVLLQLGVIDVPETRIETIIDQLEAPNRQMLANILEIFDNVLSRSEREIIIPLFENRPAAELAALGSRYFNALDQDLDRTITDLILSRNAWQSLVTLNFVLAQRRDSILKELNWHRVPDTDANKQIINRYRSQNGSLESYNIPELRFPPNFLEKAMYTTLEKTIMLKSVELFNAVPADQIFHIAQIATEQRLDAHAVLFTEGDPGDCLYILVKGQIRVHKGKQELAVFDKGTALGEMAVFDNLPRSATATALADSVLLKISREQFLEVMATRMEIMQSIVKTLSLRVRNANQQVTELSARL